MSLKYQRIKQADLLLPAPLRWLTRAFSSITLAVTLLTFVALYGMVGSVPLAFLAVGAVYGLIGIGIFAPAMLLMVRLRRRLGLVGSALLMVFAAGATAFACRAAATHLAATDWFHAYRATIVYRLPTLEMTELEFYSWWPLKLVLGLFVVNLIWATLRRIEFRFVNLGVLTVHSGIVLIAVGSIFYGSFKVEGDAVIFRDDLGGRPVTAFYDRTDPAIYVVALGREIMLPLPELPRYNDYEPGSLDIRLHESTAFQSVLGEQLQAVIPGFIAYGNLQPQWINVADDTGGAAPNPALRVALGDADGPMDDDALEATLVAGAPAQRYRHWPGLAIEFLHQPDTQRIEDLTTAIPPAAAGTRPARHGLIVEIPAAGVRAVYAIDEGMTIDVADTGYRLTVEAIGDYGMPFVTPGYEGARDTRATVRIERDGEMFRRMVMHRFPERSQDFVPTTDQAAAGMMGPMGQRRDPDPAIRLVYLDNSQAQFHLIAQTPDARSLRLIARLPGDQPLTAVFDSNRFPVASTTHGEIWCHVLDRFTHAKQTTIGVPTPRSQRKASEEGTFLHALLPVDLSMPRPDGSTWSQRVWLAHMRYPEIPEPGNEPAIVALPDGTHIALAFSRVRHPLPFAMELVGFEMQPYPGTEIPRDYVSHLVLHLLDAHNQPSGQTVRAQTRLNNPLIAHGQTLDRAIESQGGSLLAGLVHQARYGRLKLSQTGWDPGETRDPRRNAVDDQGRFLNQQRFSIIGVGNNAAIRVIFVGSVMLFVGIPWAFYVKPALLRRRKRRIQAQLSPDADAAAPSHAA